MQRRTFFSTSGKIAVNAVIAPLLIELLYGCTSIPEIRSTIHDGVVSIPTSAFNQDEGGHSVIIVRVSSLSHAIAVVKENGAPYTAYYTMCTHKHCSLDTDPDGFTCPCHGSTFDLKGRVTQGPAKTSLTGLPVTEANGILTVDIAAIL